MRPLALTLTLSLCALPLAAHADHYSTLATHKSARHRAKAAQRLGKLKGSSKAVDALVKALKDEAPRVRAAALTALTRLRAHRALFAVCALKADKAKQVKKPLKKAIRRLGGREGCAPFQIKVEIEGTDAEANALVKAQVSAAIAKNTLLKVVEVLPEARDKRVKALKLKVEVERLPKGVRCVVYQSIFHAGGQALTGFAKQKAEIEFEKVYSPDFLRQNVEACFNATSSAVVETFEDYLLRALK